MQAITKLHPGRVVNFFAGYGGMDGSGVIVAVHGTPSNRAPSDSVIRFIRQDECIVDIILFDGREIFHVHECGIDAPGIGIKLTDDTVAEDQIPAMYELAAQYKAREAIEAAQSRAAHEAAEAARVITDAPLFYWNGIKDAKGDKLQKIGRAHV